MELGGSVGGGAEAERLDDVRGRLLARFVEHGLDLGVAAEALRADGGKPGLAVAGDHLQPAVDAEAEAFVGVAPLTYSGTSWAGRIRSISRTTSI